METRPTGKGRAWIPGLRVKVAAADPFYISKLKSREAAVVDGLLPFADASIARYISGELVYINAINRLGGIQFKQLLAQDIDRFAEAFVEQFAAYSPRRVMTIDDAPHIKAIAAASRNEDHRLRAVIQNLVTASTVNLATWRRLGT